MCQEHRHGRARNQRLVLVQSDERHQTAFVGGRVGQSLLCALHEGKSERRQRVIGNHRGKQAVFSGFTKRTLGDHLARQRLPQRAFGAGDWEDWAGVVKPNQVWDSGENHAAATHGSESGESDETRFCGDQKAVDRGAHECVDQSVPGVVEELRRSADNEWNQD